MPTIGETPKRMQVIGSQAEIETLHPAVRRFIDSAWSPPSTDPSTAGLRRLNVDFPDKRSVAKGAAIHINNALKVGRDDELTFDHNPAVDQFVIYYFDKDPTHRMYRALMGAWNERRDLGTCQNCGSLMVQGKGRIAKHCSDKCRMQSARSA